MSRLAAFDIGTNTVRVLVVHAGVEVAREYRVVRLGADVDRSGELAEASMHRAVSGLRELAEIAAGADRVRLVATSACRDASNAGVFFDRVEEAIGWRPEVISGREEADLSFAGAVGTRPGRHAVIDVGGGSTEFVVGDDAPEWEQSLDIGSVRLVDRVLRERPASPQVAMAAHAEAAHVFAGLQPHPTFRYTVGVGGTFTNLAAIVLGLDSYDSERVHGAVIALDDATEASEMLLSQDDSATAAMPTVDPNRASVLASGSVVGVEALRALGADSYIASETDILDGVIAGLQD